MSDNKPIEVQFGAEIKGLLEGMKNSQDSVRTATEAMKGDLSGMIESFEKFGVAAVAIGAVGLALEGLKKAGEYIPEAIEHTNQLAEQFKGLAITAGLSTQEFNAWTTTLQLSGAKSEDLNGIVMGMQRGIRANTDVLVANGIATDAASLKHMTLGEYISAVVEKMESYGDATDRDQLLMAAFGRGGMAFAATLKEINENQAEGIALSKEGEVITAQSVASQIALAKAKGFLAHEEALNQALISSATIDTDTAYQTFKAESVKALNEVLLAQRDAKEGMVEFELKVDEATGEVTVDWQKMGAAARTANDQFKEDMKTMEALNTNAAALKIQKAAGHKAGGGKDEDSSFTSQADLAAAKAAAAEEARIQKEIAQEKDRTAQRMKDLATANEMWAIDQRIKGNAEEIKEMERVEKEKVTLAKLGAADQLNASKMLLEGQKQHLEQEVALGAMSVAQEVAQRKNLVALELAMDVQALQRELQQDGITLIQRTEVENKILALKRKSTLEIEKLDNQVALNWKSKLDQATQGWDVGIQKVLHGQMSLGQGMTGAMKQIEDQTEKSLINMGLNWAKYFIMQELTSGKAHMSQNMMDAKDSAAGAYKATVGIPFIGPVLAPDAAAAAFTETMAFAEGGWDRVPSDQVTMLHKNEMVLPAPIAEAARQTFAQGGGGGNTVHIHAMDAASFTSFLKRPANTQALLGMLGGTLRNGRLA